MGSSPNLSPNSNALSIDGEIVKQLDLAQAEVLNRAKVQVHIKLAEVTMSVSEVLDLLPGQIITLPITIEDGVTLMVGEEIIASARIVKSESPAGQTVYALQIDRVAMDQE